MTKQHFDAVSDRTSELTAAVMEMTGLPNDMRLRLAVEEVCENIATYAYPQGDGVLDVSCERRGEMVELTFSDAGVPFNPLKQEAHDVKVPLEERKVGGLGIFLAKKMMDEMEYRHENGRNVLVMRKAL